VTYHATGNLDLDYGWGQIELYDENLTLLFTVLPSGPNDQLTIDELGLLTPGEYVLSIEVGAAAASDDERGAVFDLTLQLEEELGTRLCSPAVPNSTGAPGSILVFGSDVAADDQLLLWATDLPTESNIGYFIMGTGTNTFTPPGSAGPICVAPGIRRFLPPVHNTDELAGGFLREVGTSGPISGNITAGSTWGFQAWHRDAMAGASNLTDAVQVTFQ
jgi:hypothetical protein